MRKSIERLVQGQALDDLDPFASITVLPLNSTLYAAFPSASSASLYGQRGQLAWLCLEVENPVPGRLQY